MKNLLRISALAFLLATSSQAAISLLIEPGSLGGTVFTLTQTSPSPTLNLAGISGYVRAMALPGSMFNIPGSGESTIYGDFPAALATVTEFYSGRTFALQGLEIPQKPAPVLLLLAPIYLTSGQPSARFDLTSSGPVATDISFSVLNFGVHRTQDTVFGLMTVTVIPEPSLTIIFSSAAFGFLVRRRRS